MSPGDDCEYLRTAIKEKKIGVAKALGSADVHMKFFHRKGRRATITIRGHPHAATLVDLPCVLEGMKSWDRRAGGRVSISVRCYHRPRYISISSRLYAANALCTKKRFRKRISRTAIEAVEDAVEKRLEADAQAISTRWEMISPDVGNRPTSQAFSSEGSEGTNNVGRGEYSEHEDAEEEVEDRSYFGNIHWTGTMDAFDQDIDADLEADLEAALRESIGTTTPLSTRDTTPNVEEEEDEENDSEDESLEGDGRWR
ncbi:uncharacterized protein PAC_02809 [Phialocephala subalpina]|uniref:TAFII55 protein conserved region domain-containing protein n=1 Tax=Phialocephala subalpina TaxID=576137 RepID=A0A1L7WJJ1_9HELO|nr:uncharacterized protein PAC_02809 [Phialocephala subalpina]